MQTTQTLLRLWFSTREAVSQRAYIVSGFGLGALKFAVEWLVVKAVVGKSLSPLFYLTPLLGDRLDALSPAPEWFAWSIALWTLPFLWISVSMSVRRAIDAGVSPWLGFLIVLPVLNLVMALIFCVLPRDKATAAEIASDEFVELTSSLRQSIQAVVFGTGAGIAMVAFSTLVLKSYGSALFVAAPLLIGALVGFINNVDRPQRAMSTIGVVWLSTIFAAVGLLSIGIEGAVCLIIIAPIVIAPAMIGALLGRRLAMSLYLENWTPKQKTMRMSLLVLALPLLATLEKDRLPTADFEVVSGIDVDAPPEVVWRHVVSFSEIPPPDDLIFKLGVSHPRRARIDGEGVGAIRHCEFSTGPFVEPISVWDPPTRLAFDVTSQPVPMHEWSPYHDLHPPHLDGYIRSQGGEFRLTRRADGGTRLEGSTWYELDLFPQLYFRAWADAFIHRIHMMVLEHVKSLAEREHQGPPSEGASPARDE